MKIIWMVMVKGLSNIHMWHQISYIAGSNPISGATRIYFITTHEKGGFHRRTTPTAKARGFHAPLRHLFLTCTTSGNISLTNVLKNWPFSDSPGLYW